VLKCVAVSNLDTAVKSRVFLLSPVVTSLFPAFSNLPADITAFSDLSNVSAPLLPPGGGGGLFCDFGRTSFDRVGALFFGSACKEPVLCASELMVGIAAAAANLVVIGDVTCMGVHGE